MIQGDQRLGSYKSTVVVNHEGGKNRKMNRKLSFAQSDGT